MRGDLVSGSPSGGELVHGVVLAGCLEGSLAGEVFLVVVADVGAGHVLVLDAGDTLADFGALDVLDVAEHALVAEVLAGQVVGRQSGRVVGRQGDEMVEDAGLAGSATTRQMRGLRRWVMRLMTPPLPAESRPSNRTTTFCLVWTTQSCSLISSA